MDTLIIFFLAPNVGAMESAEGNGYVFRSLGFGKIRYTPAERGIGVTFLHFCNFLLKLPLLYTDNNDNNINNYYEPEVGGLESKSLVT